MKILVLDDLQVRHDHFAKAFAGRAEVTHVYNPDQAADALAKTTFDLAYLDHDLYYFVEVDGVQKELTGADTASLIAKMPEDMRPRFVIIHTGNFWGAQEMAATLRDAGVPFHVERFTTKMGLPA